MDFYKLFIATLLCALVAADNNGDITLSDGTLIVRMDKADVYAPYFCQGCFEFYLYADKDKEFEFRWASSRVVELATSEDACCISSIFSCPWDTNNCNQHGILDLPPRLEYSVVDDGSGLRYYGNLGNSNDDCTVPAGTNKICATFSWTHTLIAEDTTVDVGGGNIVNVSAHSVKSVITVSDWPFYPTSYGLRFQILIGASDTTLLAMRLFPANTPAEDGQIYNDFNEIGIDTYERQARVQFPHVAMIGGSPVSISVNGPHPHEFDPYMYYIYIDMPRPTTADTTMEYTTFSRVLSDDLLNGSPNLAPAAWAIPLAAVPLVVNN